MKSFLGTFLILSSICISLEAQPTEALPTEALPTEALPTEALPTEAQPTRNKIIEMERELSESQRPINKKSLEILDHLAFEKIDYLAHELWKQCLLKNSLEVVTKNVFQDTQSLFDDYISKRDYYNTSKDQQRTSSFRRFLESAKLCLNLETESNHKVTIPKRRLPQLAWKLGKSKSTWLSLKSVLIPPQKHFSQNLKNWATVGKILGSEFFQGESIKWIGEKHLQNPLLQNPPRNSINIVVMNHANGHLDKLYLSELISRIPGEAGILALAQGFRSDWALSIAESNKFIHILGNRNSQVYNSTINHILESAKKGMNLLFIYPEGSSGAGIGEIKPLAPGFIQRLLPILLNSFEVNILPVTSLGAYTQLGDLSWPLEASVEFDPLILDATLRSFYEMPNAFSEVDFQIRSRWIHHLDKLENRIFGQYKLIDLERQLNIGIQNDLGCSSTLQIDP